jgi:hypothetical protein
LACSIALLALTAGCSKTEETAPATQSTEAPKVVPPSSEDVRKSAESAAADLKKSADSAAATLDKTASQVQTQGQALVDSAKKAADAATPNPEITSKAQSKIDDARKLLTEGKWSEALQILNELATMKLTPEQQSTLAALKQQAQTLAQTAAADKAADKAVKAVGGLLEKK